jgi:hypothetical protein
VEKTNTYIFLISYLDDIWSESLTEKNEVVKAENINEAIKVIQTKYGHKMKLVIRSVYCE